MNTVAYPQKPNHVSQHGVTTIEEPWFEEYLMSHVNHAAQILQVDCGDGRFTRRVAEQRTGAWVVGLEQDSRFFVQARSNLNSLANAVAIHGDPGDMPFASDEFGVAFTSLAISDSNQRQRVLAEMTRVVRPGGKVIVCSGSPTALRICK